MGLTFLDTDILIDVVLRQEPATTFLEDLALAEGRLATTSVNRAEFLRGGPQGRKQALAERILSALVEVPFGPRAAARYGRLMHQLDRSGARVGTLDGMVAAIVIEDAGRLVTRNVREMARVPGLELVSVPA